MELLLILLERSIYNLIMLKKFLFLESDTTMFNSKIFDKQALSFLSKHFLRKIRILIAVVLLVLCSSVATSSFSSPTIAQAAPVKVGINGNPWRYDFNAARGKVITSPPSAFCRYFRCIANFGNGRGYV